MKRSFFTSSILTVCLATQIAQAQVTPSINSGNPSFPFPQFLDYGADRKTLASQNAPGVTHAEMEQRTREAWQLVCNNTSPYPSTIVSGVQYLYPTAPNSCTCAEQDGYYLLGAALMGDKKYFDGYYMWAHDRGFQGTRRFIDGVINSPNYNYSKGLSGASSMGAATNVLGGATGNGNSATDGDADMAMALLIAYKQWGEKSGIILNNGGWGGKEISYKEEALNYIKAMVDTSIFTPGLPNLRYTTGVVGLDGYLKNGDSWGELTNWAVTSGYKGMKPETNLSGSYYFEYSAPAWFRSFRHELEKENGNAFHIDQFKRVEASCDWLMGQHYSKNAKNIPYVGKVSSLGNDFEFTSYMSMGADFRASWRTVMNYVWHGNPSFTWNPTTHQPEDNKPNTFEGDMGKRFAKFLKKNQDVPWSNACRNIGDLQSKLTFNGPYTLVDAYLPDGKPDGAFPLNWIHGTGAASAIAGQDFELMGEMFRQCVIAWDASSGQNLDSKPVYFSEWFRLAGMLTLAGNFHSPINMVPRANLKVYHKVDKTVANSGEQVTYTVSYRNYGSVDGTNTVLKLGVPAGLQFVNSNKGTLSGDSVVWNVGVAKGFKTGALAVTMDSMKVTFLVKNTANGRLCTSARISCSNGLGWKSNEYPNNQTAVMERNCVDIVKRGLKIEKTANVKTVDLSGNSEITYKIKFENASDTGFVNGGRPGVRLSFAQNSLTNPSAASMNAFKFRLFHDAAEPYIDYGNYRVSYFMNDKNVKCYSSTSGGTNLCWNTINAINEGGVHKLTHETFSDGSDVNGSWNQRIVLQFSPYLATISQHLQQYTGSPAMVHEGGTAMLRNISMINPSNYSNVDWTDDWSWDATMSDADNGLYFPIGDDFTSANTGTPITSWHKSACQTSTKIMKKVLVEEWDGYTWRRIYGNAPKMARAISNVVIRDTLPAGLLFKAFVNQSPMGVSATTTTISGGRTLITWSISKHTSASKDSISFLATVAPKCESASFDLQSTAWISGNDVSTVGSSNVVTVKCKVTGNAEQDAFNTSLTIAPNPAKETLHISGLENGTANVVIRDLKGTVFYNQAIQLNSDLDISALQNGAYMVEVSANGFVKQSKVLVIK